MDKAYKIIAGIGLLIFTFLLVSNSQATTSIVGTIASNSITGIKTLQGR